MISIILSSKSLICSSALFILLFSTFSSAFVSANEFPNSTFDAIEERLGEIITYTNCTQRKVEIVLPAAAKDTVLGNFYEDALDKLSSKQMASITEQVATGKMTKEIGDRCKEYIEHGLDVVFE